MEEYPTDLQKLITLAAVLLIVAGVYLGVNHPTDNGAPWASMVPTLQPTSALTVPTARPLAPRLQPTAAVVYIAENSGNVTIVNQNVCIGLCR